MTADLFDPATPGRGRGGPADALLLARMSREIRASVLAMLGYAQLLEMGLAEQSTVAGQMRESGLGVLALLDDVLALTRVEAGRVSAARERATMGDALAAVLSLTAPGTEIRGVNVVDETAPGVSVAYVGDAHRVRQILVTLVETVAALTPPGGAVRVRSAAAEHVPSEARLEGGGPWTSVTVQGTSDHLAAGDPARAFEPFYEHAARATGSARDVGLGLALARALARLMGGDLTLDAPDAGSSLSLWLPAPVDGESSSQRVLRASHPRRAE